MMLLAVQFRQLMRRYPEVEYRLLSRANDFRGYADHMGYFRFLGFDRGTDVGGARGSSTYTPIEVFSIRQLQIEAGEEPYGKYVSSKARKLAKILSQQETGPLFDLFEYTFREIMRNAVEHSRGEELIVFGQFWPANEEAEIVVMDNGIGIARNLYDNESIECANNREALKFALMPGITGVPRQVRAKQDEHWGNSGFGLYVTSRFCSETGLFRVFSGSSALTLAKGIQTEHNWSFSGTCVQMRLSTARAQKRAERISEIVNEGQGERTNLFNDTPIKASVASKMLASHFEKR